MKFKTAHATCKGGRVHRESNVTWHTNGNGDVLNEIKHATVAEAKKYMSFNAKTKGAAQ